MKVNVHLYHDDINTTAIEHIPSSTSCHFFSKLICAVYSKKREEALLETVKRCNLSDSSSAFLFGYRIHSICVVTLLSDFNVRLDGDFVDWLKAEYSSKQIL